jgi:hypothetical protein
MPYHAEPDYPEIAADFALPEALYAPVEFHAKIEIVTEPHIFS